MLCCYYCEPGPQSNVLKVTCLLVRSASAVREVSQSRTDDFRVIDHAIWNYPLQLARNGRFAHSKGAIQHDYHLWSAHVKAIYADKKQKKLYKC